MKGLLHYRLKDGSIYWHKLYYATVPQFLVRHSPPFGMYNYAHYLCKPHEYIRELFAECRWFVQRGQRGYSDRDVWSIDYYLCSWMPQALRDLKRSKHGYPIGMSQKTWEQKLDSMTEAFQVAKKINNADYRTPEAYRRALKQFRRKFNVVKMHFFDLWD